MQLTVSKTQLESAMRDVGLDSQRIKRIFADLGQQQAGSPRSVFHSTMTFHEAQDWLAANDREGADYWRRQPLTNGLIAAVGDLLEAVGDTPKLKFDAAWQDHYYARYGAAEKASEDCDGNRID